jgi:NAD(P)-dependent dehydrogenase (short-subunit alcohol dehydrogenase family)
MSIYSAFKKPGPSGFGYGSSAEDVTAGLDLAGRTILVTGVSSGIGKESARVLALRGARVIGTARTEKGAKDALPSGALGVACELADPASVRACAARVIEDGAKLDAIICNAGIMALPKRETAHGIELQLFTNHVGHFLLVTSLLDRLADTGRVVVVASGAHRNAPRETIRFDDLSMEKGYSPWGAYGQSKIANILFAKELARRFEGTSKTANAVHPGVIATNLTRHMNPIARVVWAGAEPLFLKSMGEGAATQVYVAVHPAAAKINGEYWQDVNVAKPRADARDPELARKLWTVTEEIALRI